MVTDPAPLSGSALPRRGDPPLLGRSLGAILSTPSFPSLYAWAITVAAPALRAGTAWSARAAALLALGCLVAALALLRVQPRAARWIGIYAFIACCVACWVFLGVERLSFARDPALGLIGALGWGGFAFGWGAVRNLGTVPEEHPAALRGQPLPARAHLSSLSFVASGIGALGAGACLFLAWRIERPTHALFGHVVALAAAAGLLEQAGRIAVRRPAEIQPARAGLRFDKAGFSLALLGFMLALGVVTWLLFGAG